MEYEKDTLSKDGGVNKLPTLKKNNYGGLFSNLRSKRKLFLYKIVKKIKGNESFILLATFILLVITSFFDFFFRMDIYERSRINDINKSWEIVQDKHSSIRSENINSLNELTDMKDLALSGDVDYDVPIYDIVISDKEGFRFRFSDIGIYSLEFKEVSSYNSSITNSFINWFAIEDSDIDDLYVNESFLNFSYIRSKINNVFVKESFISAQFKGEGSLTNSVIEDSVVNIYNPVIHLGNKYYRSCFFYSSTFQNVKVVFDNVIFDNSDLDRVNKNSFYEKGENKNCLSVIDVKSKIKFSNSNFNNIGFVFFKLIGIEGREEKYLYEDIVFEDVSFKSINNSSEFNSEKSIIKMLDSIFGIAYLKRFFDNQNGNDYFNTMAKVLEEKSNFNSQYNLLIEYSTLTDVSFKNSNLVRSKVTGSKLNDVSFINSNLKESTFMNNKMLNIKLDGSDIENVDFSTSTLTWFDEETKKPLDACTEFKKAKNWHLSIRPKSLACGEKIPN